MSDLDLVQELRSLCAELDIEWDDNAKYATINGKRLSEDNFSELWLDSADLPAEKIYVNITISSEYCVNTKSLNEMATAAA